MTLYYQGEHVTLYHGDCLTQHREWLDTDVLVTDPPYGIGYKSNRSKRKKGTPIAGDKTAGARDAALSAWGDERPGLVFGRWDQPRPPGTKARLIWDKNLIGTGDITSPWGTSDEEIYMLGKWPKVKPGGRAREGGKPARSTSVLRFQGLAPGSADRPDHPTPKPVPLMTELVSKCPPGVIADPFAGSGATLIAARNLGRKAIGVELEEKYCEIIAKRLDQQVINFDALMEDA